MAETRILRAAESTLGCLATLIVALLFPHAPPARAADRIILRNLELIEGRTVVSVDEDGAKLDGKLPGGSTVLSWEEIERARLNNKELQPALDKLLAELGPPLYRLRQRLKTGDYEGLAEKAETLYPKYLDRRSQTAYLVCQATMWGRLATGRREAAVEPYLRCLELIRSGQGREAMLPGPRRLSPGPDLPYCLDLAPLWFDAEAATNALPGVQDAIKKMAQPRPDEAYLYYASLAMTAGDFPDAQKVLDAVQGKDPLAAELREVVLAQGEVQERKPGEHLAGLSARLSKLHPANRLLAHYWLGVSRAALPDEISQRDAALQFLTIVAASEESDAELAAAGLYQAILILDKLRGGVESGPLRRELRTKYRETVHGKKAAEMEKK